MVYRRTQAREAILRSHDKGQLRMSLNAHGKETALAWSDVAQEDAKAKGSNRLDYAYFVLGNDLLNVH